MVGEVERLTCYLVACSPFPPVSPRPLGGPAISRGPPVVNPALARHQPGPPTQGPVLPVVREFHLGPARPVQVVAAEPVTARKTPGPGQPPPRERETGREEDHE